ncbi:MAG: HEAT repeat domain-containing protein [Ignavibacteriae bacterium]|nr:HEAT repeat domain-containing protein [Ignavibacteriota bacterium]
MKSEEQLLVEARKELRAVLRAESVRTSFWDLLKERTHGIIFPQYRIAFAALASIVVGLFAGYLIFSPDRSPQITVAEADPILSPAGMPGSFPEGETHFGNLRFIDSDASDGSIEFTFDAVSPVHIRGNINDNRIQKVLAYALINDQNPGVRLRSVNAFAARANTVKLPDREVKAALISALKSDENPGVRREALKALQSFPFDEEIKQVFLHVLMRDTNSAMRIAAINGLDSARFTGSHSDENLLTVLKDRMLTDENTYVRIRAKAVLQEVKHQ